MTSTTNSDEARRALIAHRASVALWAWRAAVLAALCWVGYELHQVRREIPGGLSYSIERAIESMAADLDRLAKRR